MRFFFFFFFFFFLFFSLVVVLVESYISFFDERWLGKEKKEKKEKKIESSGDTVLSEYTAILCAEIGARYEVLVDERWEPARSSPAARRASFAIDRTGKEVAVSNAENVRMAELLLRRHAESTF